MEATLQDLHSAHHAVLREVSGHPVPWGYGDFAAEAEAVTTGAGLMDWSACGVIGVRGPDAALFLNGVTTNNLKALPKGRAQENLLCGNKGKILHTVLVVRTKEDEYLVLTEPGEAGAVAQHLEAYHVREDLVMGLTPLVRLDLLGPQAPAVLGSLGIAAGGPGTFSPQQRDGAPLLVLNLPLGALPRFALLTPPPAAPPLVEALLSHPPARLVGLEAWEEARIWAGVPRFGVDFGPDHLPAEAGLFTHIAFDKGCYVGQEIHARMHYRGHPNRKLVAVTLPEATDAGLHAGSELFQDGQAAGHLTSLAQGTRGGQRAGIALVRYPLAAAGAPLALAATGERVATLRPVATDLGVRGG